MDTRGTITEVAMKNQSRANVKEIPVYWTTIPITDITIGKLLDNQDAERANKRRELFRELRVKH
jgi:hypothetical protein